MYWVICGKYREFKEPKISHLSEKNSSFFICSKWRNEDGKIFKEEKSMKILKILGLMNNIEKFQKTYNHAWMKHESRI